MWKKLLLKFFAESSRFWTLNQPLGAWYDDKMVHHKQWPGGLTQDLRKCYFKNRICWIVHDVKAVHKWYVVLLPGQPTISPPQGLLIPTCAGCINPMVVPYQNMCCTLRTPPPVPMVPFYEVDWHVNDKKCNVCKIAIQVYTREMQILL